MYLLVFVVAFQFNINVPDSTPEHAFYVSVIEITHVGESKQATLIVKIFTDDMQDALRNALQSKDALVADQFCADYKEDISGYFKQHMAVYLNGDPTPPIFHSCKEVGDIYQLEFTLDCPAKWDELKINADFLMELFPTQSQMVHITHNGNTVTTRLTAKNKSQTVTFIH